MADTFTQKHMKEAGWNVILRNGFLLYIMNAFVKWVRQINTPTLAAWIYTGLVGFSSY